MYDFITIGAGITGLELSALLSVDGYRVLVLESTAILGGRAQVVKKDGYTVDYGIHLIRFGPESAISKICRHLGHEVRYIPLGKSYVKDEDGRVKLFPTGPAGFLRSEMFNFRERLKALKTMIAVKKGGFEKLKGVSVKDWLDQNRVSGGLRRYFTLVSGSMMVCPFIERSSAGEMLINISKVLKTGYSVMYPEGGWKKLIDLYIEKINKNGEIRFKSKVNSVIFENKKAKGVKVGDQVIEGKNVIMSVPVQHAFDGILDPKDFPEEFVIKCKKTKPTSGVFIDYGLKKRISDTTGLWYLWKPLSFGIFTSNLEPSLAPEGKQLLTWVYPTETEDMNDPTRARMREKELEDALFELFPDLKDNIEWRRAVHLKMIDGTEVNINQYKELRVGPRVQGYEGFYLVGDSTSADGAGGDVGHESVLECYKAITSREL